MYAPFSVPLRNTGGVRATANWKHLSHCSTHDMLKFNVYMLYSCMNFLLVFGCSHVLHASLVCLFKCPYTWWNTYFFSFSFLISFRFVFDSRFTTNDEWIDNYVEYIYSFSKKTCTNLLCAHYRHSEWACGNFSTQKISI